MKKQEDQITELFMNDPSVKEKLCKARKNADDDETFTLEEAKEILEKHFHKKIFPVKKKN